MVIKIYYMLNKLFVFSIYKNFNPNIKFMEIYFLMIFDFFTFIFLRVYYHYLLYNLTFLKLFFNLL